MGEKFSGNFGNFESGALPMGREGEIHAGKNIHDEIPDIPTPGPKIGPGFLKDERMESSDAEKTEKETNREKLEKIKEIILDIDIDLLSPASTYKSMAEKLRSRDLFDDKFRTDINYYFNQKLVYLYNKEDIKNNNAEKIEKIRKKKTEAAFAGAKSLHSTIEKLEKIEESGGNDEKIKEYWDNRKTFYLNLKEKDTEHLLNREEILLDNLHSAQKYGALAEKAARDLIKNSSVYIKKMIDKDESLKNLYTGGISINLKDASINDDVYNSIDFYLEIGLKDKVKYFPVQIKCGNIDAGHGDDEKTQEYIMNNLVRLIGKKDEFFYDENSCYYEKKMTDKLNRFVDKALVNNDYKKGLFIILPRGKETLAENGDVDENVKKMFFEQFFKELASLELNQS